MSELSIKSLCLNFRKIKQLMFVVLCVIAVSGCQPTEDNRPDRVRSETRTITNKLAELHASNGDIRYSVWLGHAEGEPWYQHNADSVNPAASAIKSAILIEFFSVQMDSLDSVFTALDNIIDNPRSPAINHFKPEQVNAARNELRGLTVRELAEAMISKKHVQSNAAYNAAANVAIQYLGGPAAVTERIHRRFPGTDQLVIARYMLADRQKNDDNLLTAESLAVVLQFLSQQHPPNDLRSAARKVLWLESDPSRGDHFYKGGTLTSSPQVRIEAGWWDHRGAVSVYVVIATQYGTQGGSGDFGDLRANLSELSVIVQNSGIRIRDATLTR